MCEFMVFLQQNINFGVDLIINYQIFGAYQALNSDVTADAPFAGRDRRAKTKTFYPGSKVADGFNDPLPLVRICI